MKQSVTLNPIPLENELPLGSVVVHRTQNWQAVVMGKEIKLKKSILFYLFGRLLGIKPEKVTVYWLISLDGHDQYQIEDFNFKLQFAFRGETLTSVKILEKMQQHEEAYLIKRCSRQYA